MLPLCLWPVPRFRGTGGVLCNHQSGSRAAAVQSACGAPGEQDGNPHRGLTMHDDPIVDEVRRIRQAYAKELSINNLYI